MRERRRLRQSERNLLLSRQGGKCYYCGTALKHMGNSPDDRNSDPRWACIDHKVAVINGGKTDLNNCVMACRNCNVNKGIADG